MNSKQMRVLAGEGLVQQVRPRSWRGISINWENYAEIYKRATGECNREAKELLDWMTDVLWQYTFLSSRGKYSVELSSTGEMVNIFPNVGMRGKFIRREDAGALVEALGDSYLISE